MKRQALISLLQCSLRLFAMTNIKNDTVQPEEFSLFSKYPLSSFGNPSQAAINVDYPIFEGERLAFSQRCVYNSLDPFYIFRIDNATKRASAAAGKIRSRIATKVFNSIADKHTLPVFAMSAAINHTRNVCNQGSELLLTPSQCFFRPFALANICM